jgi:hypothetical protein
MGTAVEDDNNNNNNNNNQRDYAYIFIRLLEEIKGATIMHCVVTPI